MLFPIFYLAKIQNTCSVYNLFGYFEQINQLSQLKTKQSKKHLLEWLKPKKTDNTNCL